MSVWQVSTRQHSTVQFSSIGSSSVALFLFKNKNTSIVELQLQLSYLRRDTLGIVF